MIHQFKKNGFLISTDKRKLRLKTIHDFLKKAYWSPGIKTGRVKKAIGGSLCFGIYRGNKQIGFARVITDYASMAYLADVFIVEEFRGRGLSKWLMKCVLNVRELRGIKSWMLATRDAHGLYARFGFEPLKEPGKYMRRLNPRYE
jgi:GNAT superfamily N-acetyltransferase